MEILLFKEGFFRYLCSPASRQLLLQLLPQKFYILGPLLPFFVLKTRPLVFPNSVKPSLHTYSFLKYQPEGFSLSLKCDSGKKYLGTTKKQALQENPL